MPQANGENLRQAMDALRSHKLRSSLTVFGVVLGGVYGLLAGGGKSVQSYAR